MICQMSGRHDPCWLSTKELRAGKVAKRVNWISFASMDESGGWEWVVSPYDRDHPTPELPPHQSCISRAVVALAKSSRTSRMGGEEGSRAGLAAWAKGDGARKALQEEEHRPRVAPGG
ncbi:hypothetical protein D1007_09707 [Hordeum vulgare]|nr:hypothetical protein D1007_09707 [Hordeum vulgare]